MRRGSSRTSRSSGQGVGSVVTPRAACAGVTVQEVVGRRAISEGCWTRRGGAGVRGAGRNFGLRRPSLAQPPAAGDVRSNFW
jgi:hypothetical protein